MYVNLNTSIWTFILQDTETHRATRHIQHRPREKCACQPHTHSSGLPLRCPNPAWQQVTSMLHTAIRHCRLVLRASPKWQYGYACSATPKVIQCHSRCYVLPHLVFWGGYIAPNYQYNTDLLDIRSNGFNWDLSWDRKVCFRVHKAQQLEIILQQLNPVHIVLL